MQKGKRADLFYSDSELFGSDRFRVEEEPAAAAKALLPDNPLLEAALSAFYNGPRLKLKPPRPGKPFFTYSCDTAEISFFRSPARKSEKRDLSILTADVFIAALSRLARTGDARTGAALMDCDEVSDQRYIRSRTRRSEEIGKELMAISGITVGLKCATRVGPVSFGLQQPGPLLEITDFQEAEETRAYRCRCGQALSFFLNQGQLKWTELYMSALFPMSASHEGLAKKIGAFWLLAGTADEHGRTRAIRPLEILRFCGEETQTKNAGQIVDSFLEAHHRLNELNIIRNIPQLKPPLRVKGYFRKWLETAFEFGLPEKAFPPASPERKKAGPVTLKVRKRKTIQPRLPFIFPDTLDELSAQPALIRKFRADNSLSQLELSRKLGITRQALSNYERSLRALPREIGLKILDLWGKERGRP